MNIIPVFRDHGEPQPAFHGVIDMIREAMEADAAKMPRQKGGWGRSHRISDDGRGRIGAATAARNSARTDEVRSVPPSERQENEAMIEMYSAAMGMASETPLFRHIQGMSRDSMAQEAVVSALKLLAPEDGEITIRVGQGARVRIWRDRDGTHAEEVTERPAPAMEPLHERASKPSRADAARRADVPDCTLDEARQLGRQARRDDEPVIANPFPWDDKRRRLWDEGWRQEDGGDGMGPA